MSKRPTRGLAVVLSLWVGTGFGWADSVRVTASTVRLRQSPSATAGVVTTLARGEALEVLERAGDWYRVRTRAGLSGYVSARYVELVAATAAPSPTAPTAQKAAPAPAAPAAPLAVGHKDVGCVVAGRHPRFEACLTPADAVGRAQVLFRADEKGPWFSVDMKREGVCHAALLPKPTKDIQRFHYFIEAVDRSFSMALQPGSAPAQSYAPRVVSRESDCGKDLLVAAGNPNGSVIVNVARDAGGKVLQGTAQAGGSAPTSLSGFSMDGVTMPGNATASSAAPSVTAAAGGGIGLGVIAIGAGVVAVGATVAVVAGGGDSGATGGEDSGSSSLTGRWSGTAANGGGVTYTYAAAGVGSCTIVSDLTLDFVQSGASLTGGGSSVLRSMSCTFDAPPNTSLGASGSGTLSGTTTGNSVTLPDGRRRLLDLQRDPSRLTDEGTATPPPEALTGGLTWTATWRVVRQ